MLKTIVYIILFVTVSHCQASCGLYGNKCNGVHNVNGEEISNCLNGKCSECDDKAMGIYTYCEQPLNLYIDGEGGFSECDANCLECKDSATNCMACSNTPGVVLKRAHNANETNSCICDRGYIGTPPSCTPCYWNGGECVVECPGESEKNDQYMICESKGTNKLENDDDLVFLILTGFLSVCIIGITIFIYCFISKIFKRVFQQSKDQQYPLTEEERFFLANQQEIERARRLREEELARQLAIEEEERRKEEERRRKEKEEEERRIREEEEERRREQEEAERRRQEEEEQQRRAEEEAKRQMEEEAEKRRLEEEARQKAIAEEQERKRMLELARQAREKRIQERELQKQNTIMQNDMKLQEMRMQRENILQEKENIEDLKIQANNQAEIVQENMKENKEKQDETKQQLEEAKNKKQELLKRKNEQENQRKKLDKQLEDLDLKSIMNSIRNINQEDLQQLSFIKKNANEKAVFCLEALMMVLNNNTKKKMIEEIIKEIGGMAFKRRLLTYKPESMTKHVLENLKSKYVESGMWNIQKLYKVSQGIGAMAEWVQAVIQYNKLKSENQALFEQHETLKQEELSLQAELQSLEELENQLVTLQEQHENLKKEQIDLMDKRQGLLKKVTQHLEEQQAKQREVNELRTDAVQLDAIEEDDIESDLESQMDITDIKNYLGNNSVQNSN